MFAASTTLLPCPPERVWQEVQTSQLLSYVTAPLVTFQPISPPLLPDVWGKGRYLVQMKLFGVLSLGRQWIVISKQIVDTTPGQHHYVIRDSGSGDIATTWDHIITIRETENSNTHYTDRVEVKAGILTPLIWTFASIFYRYRQYRWRQLVQRNFAYPRS